MRYLFAFVVLFFVAAFARPTYAQEPTAEATVDAGQVTVIDGQGDTNITVESPDTPAPASDVEDNVTSLVIGAALLVVVIFSGFALTIVSQLVPAGVAKELLDSGIKAGYQMALNRAASTPGTLDDEIYASLAGIQGLEVIKNTTGHYTVRTRTPAPPMDNAGFTSTPTDNLKG